MSARVVQTVAWHLLDDLIHFRRGFAGFSVGTFVFQDGPRGG